MTTAQLAKSKRTSGRRAAVEAAKVLRQRLHEVRDRIEPAAVEWKKSKEPVHRLRVAARRAVAALDLLEPLLPRRKARRMRRMMQKIRRACDAARDRDVLLARIEQHGLRHGHAALFRHLSAERRRQQQPIVAICRDLLRSGRLERRTKKLLARVRWGRPDAPGREPSYTKFIRQRLQRPAERFQQALCGKPTSSKSLHQLRIRGKRLRYALELAGSAVSRPNRERLDTLLRQLQDHLGEINDSTMARQELRRRLALAEKSSAAAHLKRLLSAEDGALKAARKAFATWEARQPMSGHESAVIALSGIRRTPK
ncbi:MAG: CHAD domain-containing protein [Planctomycetes bacterium]|nr:CHAD domain-containing protein [Planctomycetota bacterium]